jgi:hypothetical protein
MMPPHARSRYLPAYGRRNPDGVLALDEVEPIRFDPTLPGIRRHVVGPGDELWDLAHKYFQPIPDAEHLWWVIAWFQPTPIQDLTIDLEDGRVLYIPSVRTVESKFLGR